MADRKTYETWVIQRQRDRGYGGRLTDAEVLASFKRSGNLEFAWEVWQAALMTAGVKTVCEWTEEAPYGPMPGTYESACGEAWSFIDGGPKENNVRFCQGCGKPVKLIPFQQHADEADEDGVRVDAPAYDVMHDSRTFNPKAPPPAAGVKTPDGEQA